jgi:hypothetical protein
MLVIARFAASWTLIQRQVREVKKHDTHGVGEEISEQEAQYFRTPILLSGLMMTTDIMGLLAAMPARRYADVLVSRYFKSRESVFSVYTLLYHNISH